MKRWTNRIAQKDERPLPSDDPRDVMNEILDELEDRQAGQVPASKKEQGDGETRGPKRRKAESKKARQEAKAEEALKTAGGAATAAGEGKGLNRKARRLLAKQQGGAGPAVTPTAAEAEGKKEKKDKKQRKA